MYVMRAMIPTATFTGRTGGADSNAILQGKNPLKQSVMITALTPAEPMSVARKNEIMYSFQTINKLAMKTAGNISPPVLSHEGRLSLSRVSPRLR